MNKLTKRQLEVLEFIVRERDRIGVPPTRTEICQHFGFRSPTAAQQHLQSLAAKGAIKLWPHTQRGIKVLAQVE